MKHLLATLVLGISFAHAEAVTLGNPQFAGDCPITTVISQNGANLSFPVSNVISVTGSESLSRKNCTLAVPFSVQARTQVAVQSVSVGADGRLGSNNRGSIRAEAFFAGGAGVLLNKSFTAQQSVPRSLSERARKLVWSSCGANGILRVNSSTLLQGSESAELGINGVSLRLVTRRCRIR